MEKVRVKAAHKARLKLIVLLICAVLSVFIGRLFSIQILQHEEYLQRADRQHKLKVDIAADRGRIFDSRGVPLAISRDRYSLYYDASEKAREDIEGDARSITAVLGKNPQSILKTIQNSRGSALIERKMSRQKKDEVEALEIIGVSFDVEKERYYPYNTLASQVIGYAGIDNKGLEGIEDYYNDVLSGVNGSAILQRDGHGGKRINPDFPSVPPRSGKDVVLTIDSKLQDLAENALDRAIKRCGAKSGSVVVVEPFRGEILALACYPRIDLNTIWQVRNRSEIYTAIRNRAVTDIFEPGSTFKIVTLTSALEKGLANLDERIFCENGKYLVHNHLFHDIHEYGWLKVREILELSSNIGTIKLAERVEKEGLYQMARKYGFGSRTGVDFQGEAGGVLKRLDKWSGLSLASIAIGQEISVTPLQMALAYSAIANGGFLMKPILVKEILDNNGDVIFEAQPEIIRQVMSRETSDRMKDVLVGVVERGTGTKARIEGFQVAAKTGTAEKSLPGQRGYAPGKYVTTFGGFFPVERPRYVFFVMLDEPKRNRWGGESAAPLCRELVESTIFAYDGLLNETAPYSFDDGSIAMEGRYRVLKVERRMSDGEGEAVAERDDSPVYDLSFQVGKVGRPGRHDYPFIGSESVQGKIPDVSGLSMREAFQVLSREGLNVKTVGMGRITRQEPAAGVEYQGRELCTLWGENR